MRRPSYPSRQARALVGPAFLSLILIIIEPQFCADAEEISLEPRLVPQFGHGQAPAAISYSPDGRYIVTAGGTLLLWDASSGDLLRRFGKDSSDFQCAKISPDGRQVVAGGSDGVTLAWDLASGRELARFEGHEGSVAAVAWSLDGSSLATAGRDGTTRVWNAVTKTEIRRLKAAGQETLQSVALSPDGRFLLAGGNQAAYLWELQSGDLIHTFGFRGLVLSVAFSPDGKHLIAGAKWDPVRLFETASGGELRRYEGLDFASSLSFSADGRHLALVSDNTVQVLRPESGEIVRTFGKKWIDDLFSAAFSPDGRLVACGALDGTRVYHLETGNEVLRLQGRAAAITSVAISPDGRRILTAKDNGEVDVWDAAAGMVTGRIEGDLALFSPDGRFIASGGHEDGTARLWDTMTGQEVRRFVASPARVQAPVRRLAFSSDGRLLLTGSDTDTARLWDTETGEERGSFRENDGRIAAVALSPDGRYAATSGYFTLPRLWNVASGSHVPAFREDLGEVSIEVRSLAFSPDSKHLLGGGLDGAPSLWEVSTGKLVRQFEGHTGAVEAVAFSPDGRKVLTASWDGTARLWDTASGRALTTYVGHADRVMGAVLSPDGRYVVTGSEDYTARVWEASSGRELGQLMSFSDGSWAVADRDGRFDASNGGAVDGLHWVAGLEAIALSQLKDRYYEPHLLSKTLGLNNEALSEVATLASPAMFPSVAVTRAEGPRAMLALELTNRGGGIGRVVVRINGKEITSDARPPGADPDGRALQLQVPLDGLPYLIPGGKNRIEIRAYNAEGYLSSRGVSVEYDSPREASGDAPSLWAVVAGVSDYTGDAIDLRYAAKDAADMAQALQLAARRLFGAEHVRLRFLSTAGRTGMEPPTKAALERAFQELGAASSRDILVVYLSGHGIAYGDDYYFLTQEARSAELGDPAVRARAAISGGEMITWLKQSPALKQVMILDTCAAGAAAAKLVEQRTITSDQIRAIERLKDRTGFHVLMGSAADRVSYEATQYEQGLLTHALLRGMRGAALREGQFVDVSLLFQHAADEVPRLAEHIGGIQRPHIAAPKGTSFDIGQLSTEDRERVPLTVPKPLLLQPVLQNVDELFDDLGLETRLRAHLREASYASARGTREALPAVYIDAEQLAGAIWPRGHYQVRGDDVTVRMALVKDGKRLAEVRVEASRADLDALTEKLADALLQAAANALR